MWIQVRPLGCFLGSWAKPESQCPESTANGKLTTSRPAIVLSFSLRSLLYRTSSRELLSGDRKNRGAESLLCFRFASNEPPMREESEGRTLRRPQRGVHTTHQPLALSVRGALLTDPCRPSRHDLRNDIWKRPRGIRWSYLPCVINAAYRAYEPTTTTRAPRDGLTMVSGRYLLQQCLTGCLTLRVGCVAVVEVANRTCRYAFLSPV